MVCSILLLMATLFLSSQRTTSTFNKLLQQGFQFIKGSTVCNLLSLPGTLIPRWCIFLQLFYSWGASDFLIFVYFCSSESKCNRNSPRSRWKFFGCWVCVILHPLARNLTWVNGKLFGTFSLVCFSSAISAWSCWVIFFLLLGLSFLPKLAWPFAWRRLFSRPVLAQSSPPTMASPKNQEKTNEKQPR